jgi:hypothetical protein
MRPDRRIPKPIANPVPHQNERKTPHHSVVRAHLQFTVIRIPFGNLNPPALLKYRKIGVSYAVVRWGHKTAGHVGRKGRHPDTPWVFDSENDCRRTIPASSL